MNESSSDLDPRVEEILLQFEEALRQTREPDVVLREFCRNHPEIADDLRELADMVNMLGATPNWEIDGGPANDPPPHDPKVLGPYKILRPIGYGGMGTVYEAVEETLDRHVAVKTIRPGRKTSATLLLRFDRERRLLARVHHTHIVPIFATGQEDDLLYFAMPYIGGASLGQVIKTAQSHGSNGGFAPSSTFEELVKEAHSQVEAENSRRNQDGETPVVETTTPVVEPALMKPLPDPCIRAAVKVMAAVSEALHHAHMAGIVHRDLKPSNIMVETNGHPWVLDFGLSRLKPQPDATANGFHAEPLETQASEGDRPSPEGSMTLGFLGTPLYAAPEQHRFPKSADARADVWSLGATLYELITLHRPFSKSAQILDASHALKPPRAHNLRIPRDLEAIVLKALSRDPAHRYQNALLLSKDLNRWLRGEPVTARPARTIRRVTLWSKRHPWGAGAVGVIGLLLVSLGVTGFALARNATAEKQAKQREVQMLELQRQRLWAHTIGWSQTRKDLLRGILAGKDNDPTFLRTLRDEAVAGMIGFDATTRSFTEFGASSLAFGPKNHLLMGGVIDPKDHHLHLPTRIWDGDPLALPREFKLVAEGPVGFFPDGRPLQVEISRSTILRRASLILHDLEKNEVIREIPLPHKSTTITAVLADGPVIAALIQRPADATFVPDPKFFRLIVWDGMTGKELRRFNGDYHAVALSPNGKFVAAGDGEGRVTIWSIASGEKLAVLSLQHRPIQAVAFGRNPHVDHRPGDQLPEFRSWQIAAGDVGGLVGMWDLASALPVMRSLLRIRGDRFYGLAFSPDGSMLATAEQGPTELWDVATGDCLLKLAGSTGTRALAFNSAGTQLAFGYTDPFTPSAGVFLNTLQNGHGVRSLIGLGTEIRQIIPSPDDRLVAAMGIGWQIAIWERKTGRLVALLDAPPGLFNDNVGLAISPDNRRIAFSSHEKARMWDIETGAILGDWSLPIGLSDKLCFQGPDHLYLARAEAKGGTHPYGGTMANRLKYPTFCAIYDLLGDQARSPKPLRTISDLNLSTHRVWIAPDGRHLVLDGRGGEVRDGRLLGKDTHTARIYTFPAGEPRSADLVDTNISGGIFHTFDPEGSLLALHHETAKRPIGNRFRYLPMPSGEPREAPHNLTCLGPKGQRWAAEVGDEGRVGYFIEGRPDPLFTVERDSPLIPHHFTRDGQFAIGGRYSSPATVLDFREIDEQLRKLGLAW